MWSGMSGDEDLRKTFGLVGVEEAVGVAAASRGGCTPLGWIEAALFDGRAWVSDSLRSSNRDVCSGVVERVRGEVEAASASAAAAAAAAVASDALAWG